jgi:predicted RNA-binding Zn-ribbon protein involved in translation (DUF1610 family)
MNDAESTIATNRAIAEGRVDGKFRCPRCGMRSRLEEEAIDCCKGLGPAALERVSESRYDRFS